MWKEPKEKCLTLWTILPQSPFNRVACTCWVYNTVLWCFSWWYLYFCIHFDPVISGFYKAVIFKAHSDSRLFFSALLLMFSHSNQFCWPQMLVLGLGDECKCKYKYMHTDLFAVVDGIFCFLLCLVLLVILFALMQKGCFMFVCRELWSREETPQNQRTRENSKSLNPT